MRNNDQTAALPLTFGEHRGILTAQFLGVPYVGKNVRIISGLPPVPVLVPVKR